MIQYDNTLEGKYFKMEDDAFRKVILGKITSYDDLLVELMLINDEYEKEYEEQNDVLATTLDRMTTKAVYGAEADGEDLKQFAWTYLRDKEMIFGICEEFVKEALPSRFYDEEGFICDEHGVRLSQDGEYRAFEVISGEKKD
jgi:hypothetical protein